MYHHEARRARQPMAGSSSTAPAARPVGDYIILCYIMLYYSILCYGMVWYVMLVLCYVILYYIIL